MILFCEECGQRNSITLTPALIESNSFTCQFCRFRSPFPFIDKRRNSTSSSTAITWQPEKLHLTAEAGEKTTRFQLVFEVAGMPKPTLTVEPFYDFISLITVEKTGLSRFAVTVKALADSKEIPPGWDGPALIFCEENIMSWGTISMSRAQQEGAQAQKFRRKSEETATDAPTGDSPAETVESEAAKPEPASAETASPRLPAGAEALRQQLKQCQAELHRTKTTSLRLKKELSMQQQITDRQNCGILFVSPEQRILYANPVFLSRCGCTLNAVQTMRLDQLIMLPKPGPSLEAALREAEKKGGWQGRAVLKEPQDEQQRGVRHSFSFSITRSSGGKGGEEGFVCLFDENANGDDAAPPVCAAPAPAAAADKEENDFSGISHDPLTGLADRPSFQRYLEDSVDLSGEEGEQMSGNLGLLYVDLDHFKRINRIFGPGFGDKILCSVATILKKCAKEAGADMVARLNGDEFAIILPPPTDRERAKKLAERIMQRFRTPVKNESRAILIRPSIGFSIYPEDGGTPLELLRNADTAMEAAKNEGGNRISQWDSGMKIQAAESLYLENDLRKAVADDDLINFYQPQINLSNGSICGMEALAPWIHPVKGLISPAAFIPIAETTGLIEKMGLDLIRKACAQGKKWRDMGFKKFIMAVNLSGRLLRRRDLYHQIMSCVESTGFPPEALEVEFTEGVLIENMDFTVDLINRLREQGVKTAIDDFGTGYSSLTYLQYLKVDKIKIDRSFITNVTTNRTDAAITLGIISIAKNLGFKVIAEGVETEDHMFFLQKSRCDEGQGFLFSAPISEKDMTNLLLRDSSVALSHKRMIDRFYSIQAKDFGKG
jgi:diguanylate cyclase (GGDEF)-like protein